MKPNNSTSKISLLILTFMSFLAAGCIPTKPSDERVKAEIIFQDAVLHANCASMTHFNRLNGFGDNNEYTVEFEYTIVGLVSVDDCVTMMIKKGVLNPEKFWDFLFLGSDQPSPTQTTKGSLVFINTEKGWRSK
jgi:hypothetical protein